MSDRSYSPAERRKILLDAASSIAAYKQEQKDLSDSIKETKENVCGRLDMAPKALDLILKYLGLTPGERTDLEAALTLAQQALDDSGTGDLFGFTTEGLPEGVSSVTLKVPGKEPVTVQRRPRAAG
jgi:hypothetical protein